MDELTGFEENGEREIGNLEFDTGLTDRPSGLLWDTKKFGP